MSERTVTFPGPDDWRSAGGGPLGGRYEVLDEVARGGMGVVYRARHRQLGKPVALKLVLPGASVERFLREAQVLARIASPHVVTVHDYDVLPDGRPVLVMEWVDGLDLARTLHTAGGPLPEDRVLPWMRQVAEGMKAAADQGVTHRDLKPSNVLIDRKDEARVADFGLARAPAGLPELTASGGLMGTPYYMAPEQAESPKAADTRADVYSFGATFYHVLTGAVPFDGESAFSILFKHKTEPLVAPRARNPALSDRVCGVLERCLAKSPGDRFGSFADLLKHLQPAPASVAPWQEDDADLTGYIDWYRHRREVYLDPDRWHQIGETDEYVFPGGRTLTVRHGDIARQNADAVVSSDNNHLTMVGAVGRAIRQAAGWDLLGEEVKKFVPVKSGRVVVTSAGSLAARFIFHGVTIAREGRSVRWPTRDLILEILHSCVYHADTLGVETIALPLLGTGGGGFSPGVCLDTMFQFWVRTLLRGLTTVRAVRIVLYG